MRNKKLIVLTVFIILLILSGFLAYKELSVKHIVIIGNKHLTEKEIREIMGLKEGDSIVYPSSKGLYERLKKIPWIKDAVVRKDLNGTVTIYVKEATPLAIATINGKYYLVDNEAQILEDFTDKIQNRENSSVLLPVIKNIDPFKNKETFNEAVNLLSFINAKGFVNTEDKITITITGHSPEELTLNINSFPIIVGRGEFEAKFAKYLVVNEEIQKRGLNVQYIDLRVPDRVIVKPLD